MTPAARLQAAIDILSGLGETRQSLDRYLRQWFRTRRFAGSKDRAAIGERVFTIMRRRASFAWRMQSDHPRALVVASLLDEGADIPSLFTGGYGPPPLSEEEAIAIAQAPMGDPPRHAANEFPSFLEDELVRAFGDGLEDEMRAMQMRAPIDLRANRLKTDREKLLKALADAGIAATPTVFAPHGIRIASGDGLSVLSRLPLFERGGFEFQDEAAQIASHLCGAKPGMRVLDLAAGAGGKSLALAADMQNSGEIVAFDIDPARLARLDERKERAGASIIRSVAKDIAQVGDGFDIVLVDAPCSGTGTWRRQPEQRWRLDAERLDLYRRTQTNLLADAAELVKKGGRLIYATCSLLPSENADQVEALLNRRPDFRLRSPRAAWREQTGQSIPPGLDEFFVAAPFKTQTDGFFAALMDRV